MLQRLAGGLRVLPAQEALRLAFDADLAFIGLVDAGEHFDQGGFARAVLAHQRVDFTGIQPQSHARERPHGSELFGNAGKLQHRCHSLRRWWCVCHVLREKRPAAEAAGQNE